MISRDWVCLNQKCKQTFHSFDPFPECPGCGNVRVHWIPGGGHIHSASTKKADNTLRGLAEKYGFTNLNSPSHSRLNRAAPIADHPGPEQLRGQHTFAPGFRANVYHKSSCEPSLVRNNIKGTTVAINDNASGFRRSKTVAGPELNAVTVARHRGVLP